MLALGACGDNRAAIACVAGEHVTAAQGLYGRVTYQSDDEGFQSPRPIAGELVQVHPQGSLDVVASAVSDANGAFQIELAEGSYAVCTDANCVRFDIDANRLVRVDLRRGPVSVWTLETPTYCSAD